MQQSFLSYLGHVDNTHCEGFVAQDGSVLVPLPPLHHHMQTVHISLQEVKILHTHTILHQRQEQCAICAVPHAEKGISVKCATCREKVSSRSVSMRPSGGRRYSLDLNVRLEP